MTRKFAPWTGIAIIAAVAAILVLVLAGCGTPTVGSTPITTSAATENANNSPKLTTGQKEALGAAEQYQSFMYYSKAGLKTQLVQFDKFDAKDAQYAVDHLDVDWNVMAVKKAQQYLSGANMSRAGLLQQLTVYEKFTKAQAEQAVTKAFNSAD